MHMTSRELVRRWFGQIQAQPPYVANATQDFSAHTIIPAPDKRSFGTAQFAPLSGCIDLVLQTQTEPGGKITAVTVRGYRAGYDPGANSYSIDSSGLLFIKDLLQRPYRDAQQPHVIDSDGESAVLLSALEMDSEREAASSCAKLLRSPPLPSIALSFSEERAPEFHRTTGLLATAFDALFHKAPPLRSLCSPANFRGVVYRVLRAKGVTAIAITPDSNVKDADGNTVYAEPLIYEVPAWAEIKVRQGERLLGNKPLARLTLSDELLNLLSEANHTPEQLWAGVVDNIGEHDAADVLRMVWDSHVTSWAGMTMVSARILDTETIQRACGVWRDLRDSLGRVCHNHRAPNKIERNEASEGRISVWSSCDDGYNLCCDSMYGKVDMMIE